MGKVTILCLLGALSIMVVQPLPNDSSNNTSNSNQKDAADKIDALIRRVTANEQKIASNKQIISANHNTIASNEKTIALLNQRLSVYTKQCKLEAHDACGPCVCKEDRRLKKKYYCDCTLLEARKDCLVFYQEGHKVDGIYIVEQLKKKFQVFCDMTTDGGGWTVIQRRNGDPFVNFYRPWDDYKNGFGDLQHEHWLGNEYLHAMSLTGQCLGANDLRVDMVNYDSDNRYVAKYNHFAVNSEFHKYRLSVGNKISGNASNYLTGHNAMKFSTYDQDNDASSSDHCARKYKGGWWYTSCYGTNPNSRYMFVGDNRGDNNPTPIYWYNYLKSMEFKIRRNKEGNCAE